MTALVFSLLSFFTPGPDLPVPVDVWDKLGHASIFFALAVTGRLAGFPFRGLLVGLFGYAVVTELLQAWLPIQRDGDWHDVVADSVGTVAGLLVVGIALRVRRRSPAGH